MDKVRYNNISPAAICSYQFGLRLILPPYDIRLKQKGTKQNKTTRQNKTHRKKNRKTKGKEGTKDNCE